MKLRKLKFFLGSLFLAVLLISLPYLEAQAQRGGRGGGGRAAAVAPVLVAAA